MTRFWVSETSSLLKAGISFHKRNFGSFLLKFWLNFLVTRFGWYLQMSRSLYQILLLFVTALVLVDISACVNCVVLEKCLKIWGTYWFCNRGVCRFGSCVFFHHVIWLASYFQRLFKAISRTLFPNCKPSLNLLLALRSRTTCLITRFLFPWVASSTLLTAYSQFRVVWSCTSCLIRNNSLLQIMRILGLLTFGFESKLEIV